MALYTCYPHSHTPAYVRVPAQAPAGAYSGSLEVARKSVAEEGVLVLWRGFTPAFVKLAPYSIISLTLLERCSLTPL